MSDGIDRRALLAAAGGAALAPTLAAAAGPTVVPAPDRVLRVAVPGGKVHVRVNGRLDGPRAPILLIHGGPGGCHASLAPALALAGERGVILYDQLDSGLSDRPLDPANWTVPRFVAEVAAIRAALDLDRVHLLGHSWGATVALEHAVAMPNGIASLVLMGPLVSTAVWMADAATLRGRLPAATQAVLTACEGPTPPAATTCAAGTQAFYDRYWRLRAPAPAFAAYEASIPHPFSKPVYEAMWGPNEFRATGTLARYDGTPLLARITMPTLVLIGGSDEVTEATGRGFAARVPGGTFAMIPDAAHRLQTDRTGAFLAMLRGWLARHDKAASA